MISQATTTYRTTASSRRAGFALASYDVSVTGRNRHLATGECRVMTTPVIPVAPTMTTTVANFWKQLTGGIDPPAPEPFVLT